MRFKLASAERTSPLDLAAWALSAACLGHCLALPLLYSVYPLLQTASEAEWVHWAFFVLAAPVSIAALSPKGTSGRARVLAGAGLALLAAGAADLPSHDAGRAVSVAGALILSLAHILNALSPRRPCCADGAACHPRP